MVIFIWCIWFSGSWTAKVSACAAWFLQCCVLYATEYSTFSCSVSQGICNIQFIVQTHNKYSLTETVFMLCSPF